MAKLYRTSIAILDKITPTKFQPFMDHPAGPKTVFFWAPAIKWGLVIAAIGDLQRHPSQISVPQSGALAVTGVIWSRYAVVVIPKNWFYCSVNVAIAGTQMYQFCRAFKYQQSLKARKPVVSVTAAK